MEVNYEKYALVEMKIAMRVIVARFDLILFYE